MSRRPLPAVDDVEETVRVGPRPMTGPAAAALSATQVADTVSRREAIAVDVAAAAAREGRVMTAEQAVAAAEREAIARVALRNLDMATGRTVAAFVKFQRAETLWQDALAQARAAGVAPEEIALHEARRRRELGG